MPRKKLAKKQGNAPQIMAAAVMLIFIAVVIFALGYYALNQPEENDELFCPAQGPKDHLVLLVDKSEKLNFTQRSAITTRYEALLKQELSEGDMLSVFAMGANVQENATPLFQRCHPGDTRGKSELTDNLARIEKRYRQEFLDPALSILTKQSLTVESESSPIIETLQIVSINSFQRFNSTGQKRLVLVSDMIQHTDGYSMYRDKQPEFPRFKDTPFGKKSSVNLQGVMVELNYVFNYPNLQTRRNSLFWEHLIDESGGSLVKINKVEG